MPKFFVTGKQIKENKIYVIGNDVNHIINVLRLDLEDKITICNKETGENYLTKIIKKEQEEIICEVLEKIENQKQENVEVTIFQGLPKFDKMELIIEKCTELGAKEIAPVQMERCVVKLDSKAIPKKIERWQKIAEAASKQCKRNSILKVNYPVSIKDICDMIDRFDILFVPYENEKQKSFKEELQKIKKDNLRIGIVIGPEGGFHEKEILALEKAGAKVVTLGTRILRTETVAIAMTSAIMYELGYLG